MSGLLITSRRNFLTRAFGVTAAGAAITVPIVTVALAEEQLRHQVAGVEAAFADLFPGAAVHVQGNCLDGHHAYYNELVARRDRGIYACAS
jgi:hypothetical protein